MNLCKGFRLLWTACRMTRHQHNPRNIDIAYTTLSASTNGTALFLPKHTVDSELVAGLCISFNIYIVLNEIKLSVDKCNTQAPQRSEILIVAVIMGKKKNTSVHWNYYVKESKQQEKNCEGVNVELVIMLSKLRKMCCRNYWTMWLRSPSKTQKMLIIPWRNNS